MTGKKIVVLGTGGTIAGQSTTRTSFQSYRAGSLQITDMVDFLRPQIDSVAEVTAIRSARKSDGALRVVVDPVNLG